MNETTKLDRRELGVRAARWFSLTLLGGGGAFLWWRNGSADPCPLASSCRRYGTAFFSTTFPTCDRCLRQRSHVGKVVEKNAVPYRRRSEP